MSIHSKGALMAAAVASLVGCAGGSKMSKPSSGANGDMVHCAGINSCKGQGACAGQDNSCKGQNGCKGKGWIEASSSDCTAKGGTVVTMNKQM